MNLTTVFKTPVLRTSFGKELHHCVTCCKNHLLLPALNLTPINVTQRPLSLVLEEKLNSQSPSTIFRSHVTFKEVFYHPRVICVPSRRISTYSVIPLNTTFYLWSLLTPFCEPLLRPTMSFLRSIGKHPDYIQLSSCECNNCLQSRIIGSSGSCSVFFSR